MLFLFVFCGDTMGDDVGRCVCRRVGISMTSCLGETVKFAASISWWHLHEWQAISARTNLTRARASVEGKSLQAISLLAMLTVWTRLWSVWSGASSLRTTTHKYTDSIFLKQFFLLREQIEISLILSFLYRQRRLPYVAETLWSITSRFF